MILGITGSIGAGKSTVREEFSSLGWRFFDADAMCHEIYASPEGEFFNGITACFGPDILSPEGKIDRKKLAAKVFGQPENLNKLTGLIYPELNRRLDAAIVDCRKNGTNGAFEIPLLYENGYQTKFDAVLTVWSASEVRHRRLREQRNFTEEEILEREKKQLPADDKLNRADLALINNGSRELLRQQIIILTNKIAVKD